MGIMNIEHYVTESRQLNKNNSRRDYYNYKTIFTPPNNFYVTQTRIQITFSSTFHY